MLGNSVAFPASFEGMQNAGCGRREASLDADVQEHVGIQLQGEPLDVLQPPLQAVQAVPAELGSFLRGR